jgi:hypothetical protein
VPLPWFQRTRPRKIHSLPSGDLSASRDLRHNLR